MKKILLSMFLTMFFPASSFAGYMFHQTVSSDGNKSKIIMMTEGANRRIDVYVDGNLSISMISNSKIKTPLYIMHDSETYMKQLPGIPEIPTEFPEMNYEPPKQPVNPAQKALDAMETAEKTQNMVDYFKHDPLNAAQDAMGEAAYQIESYQQEQMMKQQMAKVKAMQKQMAKSMEGQMKQMKGRMEKDKRLKNSIKVADFTIKPAGKKKKIGKYNTDLIQVYYQGEHFQDRWVTKDFPKDAAMAINSFTDDSKINDQDLANYFKVMKALNDKVNVYGLSVSTISYFKGKSKVLFGAVSTGAYSPKEMTVDLSKVEKKQLSAKEFDVPKGYQEVNL